MDEVEVVLEITTLQSIAILFPKDSGAHSWISPLQLCVVNLEATVL